RRALEAGAREERRAARQDRHRDRRGDRVLPRRGLPSGLLQAQRAQVQLLQVHVRAAGTARGAVGAEIALAAADQPPACAAPPGTLLVDDAIGTRDASQGAPARGVDRRRGAVLAHLLRGLAPLRRRLRLVLRRRLDPRAARQAYRHLAG